MQKFSNRLISLRKERSLTQEDLAKIIHKKRSTVSGYETEGKEPDLETVCFLAKYFGVSTDYLLGHSDEPKSRRAGVLQRYRKFRAAFQEYACRAAPGRLQVF